MFTDFKQMIKMTLQQTECRTKMGIGTQVCKTGHTKRDSLLSNLLSLLLEKVIHQIEMYRRELKRIITNINVYPRMTWSKNEL